MTNFPDERLGFEQQMAVLLAHGNEEDFTQTLFQFLNHTFGFQHEVKEYDSIAEELADIKMKLIYLLRVYRFLEEHKDHIFAPGRELRITVATLLDPLREVDALVSVARVQLERLTIKAPEPNAHLVEGNEPEAKPETTVLQSA